MPSRPEWLPNPRTASDSARDPAGAWSGPAGAPKVSVCPASAPCIPGVRGADIRPAIPSSACSATVRPSRPSHAAGIGSSFTMVPTATPSPIAAPRASDSTTSNVSDPSSWLSS